MILQITEQELLVLKDTLDRMNDELDTLSDHCDAVFNSGVEEGIEDSLEIVNSILNVAERERQKELDIDD